MKTNKEMNLEINEKSGEELLKEYMSQDKDKERHRMGYSVYAQTYSDCGCCC